MQVRLKLCSVEIPLKVLYEDNLFLEVCRVVDKRMVRHEIFKTLFRVSLSADVHEVKTVRVQNELGRVVKKDPI